MKTHSLQFSFLDTSYAQLINLSQYIVFPLTYIPLDVVFNMYYSAKLEVMGEKSRHAFTFWIAECGFWILSL